MTPNIRRLGALICLVSVASIVTACTNDDTWAGEDPVTAAAGEASEPDAQSADDTEVSWLASQTATSGRIEFTDGEPTRLVLDGVDAHTVMFSDRPDRLTDVVDTAAITEQWDELFADSAPNAVLVEHRPAGDTDSLVVVLTNPVLDTAARTLSYDIEVLADEDHPESVSGLVGYVHDDAPTEFLAATLFIDSMASVEEMDEEEMEKSGSYIDQKAEDAADAMEQEAEDEAESMDDAADAVEDKADEMAE